MTRISRRLAQLSLALCVAALGISKAYAHEDRDLGDGYSVDVGFNNEEPPNPYAGGPNGLDFYPFIEVPVGSGNFVSLDTKKGDKVEIEAVAIIVKAESWDAPILKKIELKGPFKRTIGEEGFIDYLLSFTPDRAGVWGFIVKGSLQAKGKKEIKFNEKFVCGAGSLDPGSDFACVGPHP